MSNRNEKNNVSNTTGKCASTSKSNGCTKKGNSKQKRYGKSRSMSTDRFDASAATNNPAWYGADAALLRDSASIPFSYPVGTPIDLNNPALKTLPSGQAFTIPGFMTLYTSPSIGWTDDPSDPINVAAFRVYTYVRHMNSGHTNYDAPDLMLYLLAMSQVYSYINFLQRAYGIVYTYAQKNRYFPNALLESMYINSNDVRTNLAQFRYGINILINKAASLCVPATMAIFAQQASLYQNLYIEGDSLKDQMYLFSPSSFWTYALNSDTSGMLTVKQFYGSGEPYTVDRLLAYGSELLSVLIQSEDMNIMSGDIRKAYGDSALIKLVPLNVDFPIAPIRDIAVLQQIKNATVVPVISGLSVTQDATHGFLMHKPMYQLSYSTVTWQTKATMWGSQTFLEDKIISVNSPEPTPEEVMETTRLIPVMKNYSRTEDWKTATFEVHGCTVLVRDCKIWDFKVDKSSGQTLRATSFNYSNTVLATESDSVAASMRLMSLLAHFKYHPVTHLITARPGSQDLSFNVADGYLCYDVDNYTVVPGTTLERMHEAALLSMLNVPTVTKIG